jgi:hypothetical protein
MRQCRRYLASSATAFYRPGDERHSADAKERLESKRLFKSLLEEDIGGPDLRPTLEKYEGMSDADLEDLLKTRRKQVRDLRHVYHNSHNEVERLMRKQQLDYTDFAMNNQVMQVKMMEASKGTLYGTVIELRKKDWMVQRDAMIVFIVLFAVTVGIYIFLSRHYIHRSVLLDDTRRVPMVAIGASPENIFFRKKQRSARVVDTEFEREQRLKDAEGSKATANA